MLVSLQTGVYVSPAQRNKASLLEILIVPSGLYSKYKPNGDLSLSCHSAAQPPPRKPSSPLSHQTLPSSQLSQISTSAR